MKRHSGKFYAMRRKWRSSTEGTAAVEFALVAIPFLWVLIGTMELAMLMYFNSGLEYGVDRASRMIRTGQAYSQNLSKTDFRDKVCSHVLWTEKCKRDLKVEVRSFTDFGSISLSDPQFDKSGNVVIPDNYDIGGPREVVVVRVFFKWKFLTPFIGGKLLGSQSGDNSILLGAATTFRNEPYPTN